jgi:chromosome segregation ATPase
MGKAAYERGNKAIRHQLDEEYRNNPHAQASRVISGLENKVETLQSRLTLSKEEIETARNEIAVKDARIAELEILLAKSEHKAQLEHEQYMRWFRHAENLRQKWVIQSKVIRTALSPDEYKLARDIVREYDGV